MRSQGRSRRRYLKVILAVPVVLLLCAAGVWFWIHRSPPQPGNTHGILFDGITYTRDVRTSPRPLVISVATVSLRTPGVSLFVTPGTPGKKLPLRGQLLSHALTQYHAQLAINADFFAPWHSNSPWDYYPHIGDPVGVRGLAASRGVIYADHSHDPHRYPHRHTLYLSADNHASIDHPVGPVYNAVSGDWVLLVHGVVNPPFEKVHNELQPRTAAGIKKDGNTLILVTVDGRQPGYSEGATLTELAGILHQYGADTGINFDGGGSTEMACAGPNGVEILNSPIDNHIPGRERPLANHLIVFAQPARR